MLIFWVSSPSLVVSDFGLGHLEFFGLGRLYLLGYVILIFWVRFSLFLV